MDEGERTQASEPQRLIWLGPRCNNHCFFCPTAEPSSAPSEAELFHLAGQAQNGTVTFAGGEPTLYPQLPALIEAARKAGASRVLLQTNARRLCYRDYARMLADAGLTELEASLCGTTPAMHEYHTEAPGSFAQTIEGIRRARGSGLSVTISTVITRSNYRHLSELTKIAKALGAERIRCRWPLLQGRAEENASRLLTAPELVRPYWESAVRLAQSLRIGVHGPIELSGERS